MFHKLHQYSIKKILIYNYYSTKLFNNYFWLFYIDFWRFRGIRTSYDVLAAGPKQAEEDHLVFYPPSGKRRGRSLRHQPAGSHERRHPDPSKPDSVSTRPQYLQVFRFYVNVSKISFMRIR